MKFAIDAVSITIRSGTAVEIMDAVERGLVKKTPWEDSGYSWETKTLGYNGWAAMHSFAGGDITLMEGQGFISCQMKSRACTVVQDRLADWLVDAQHNGGASATRIDAVWWSVPWHPAEFLAKLRSDELVSSQRKHGAGWIESDDGATATLPPYAKRKGCPRFLRLYNQRGYNRLELQLNKPDADTAFRQMNSVEPHEWSEKVFIPMLLRSVDFRSGPQKHVTARKRSAWWAEFVGEAKKAS